MAPGLSDLQQVMHDVLRGRASVGVGAEKLGVDPGRLGIYAAFVAGHVRYVLDKDYGATQSLLTPARWAELCESYFASKAPSSFELNQAAAGFPEFLDEQLAAGREGLVPFHVALARLEWEDFATYVHSERIPPASELTGPLLNPTLSLIELPCPVVRWYVAWNRDEPYATALSELPGPDDGPERVLLFRRPTTERTAYFVAVDDLMFAVAVAHRGLDPLAAAAAAGLPADAALAAWERAVELELVLVPASDASR